MASLRLAGAALVAAGAAAPPPFAAVVDARHAGTEGAAVRGVPTFRTVGAALAAAPVGGVTRYRILLRNGRYREKLTVDRARVTIVGESRDSAVITFDANADTPNPGANAAYGTRGSYTLRVAAPDFRAERLTIENAFDLRANQRRPAGDPARVRNTQAVAVMTDVGSDRAAFVGVRILGFQDTLFPNVGRSYFRDCEVVGSVDFIFGAGQAVFDRCDIVSRDMGDSTNNGFVVAPSTDLRQPYGFLFVNSRLRKETPRLARGSVALGRPWHPAANRLAFGSAVFVDCWMDDHISARGWESMGSTDSVSGTRYTFAPTSARFFEYRSHGPGAAASPTRRVLTDGDARGYTAADVLGDWIPDPPEAP